MMEPEKGLGHVLAASRTPFTGLGGALASVGVVELARAAVARALKQAGAESGDVGWLVLATSYHQTTAPEIAREVMGRVVPCPVVYGGGMASGLFALTPGGLTSGGQTGAPLVLVLAVDSASTAPHFLPGSTRGARLGHGRLRSVVSSLAGETPEGLPDPGPAAAPPDAPVTAGSRRAPIAVEADDESETAWAPGDGAAALLLSGAAGGGAIVTTRRSSDSTAGLLEVVPDGSVLLAPPAGRPAPPAAAGLAAARDAVLAIEGGAAQALALAGQPPYGFVGQQFENSGK